MKLINIAFYKDGGSCLLKTDKGTFYQDNAIDSKNKGAWYKAAFDKGNKQSQILNPELIEKLETFKWHRKQGVE